MPFRTKHSYSGPGIGTTVIGRKGAKTHSGPGGAPPGVQQVPEKTISEVPVVTTSPSGQVTTSGYASQRAARRATRKQRTAVRTERRKTRALNLTRRSAAQQRRITSQNEARFKQTERAIEADRKTSTTASKGARSASRPALATQKPPTFEGKKTAGTPTRKELSVAKQTGTLKTNQRGYLTTPAVRKTVAKVKQAQKIVAKTQPRVSGLSTAERAVVPLVRKANRKYPDVPKSVLMSDIRQESNFDPAAKSSADAEGLSQFIPSTAASYGVQYGTGRREQQSQVTGQAHYLHDLGFAKDPQGALSSYSGGYAASDYNNPVLEGAKDYKALDKPGSPKATKHLRAAKAQASKLGLKGLTKGKPRVSKQVLTRFNVAKKAASELTKAKIPYVWGGGHGGFTDPRAGLDCSGAVSYVLHKMGVLKSPLTSGDMGSVLKPGPGLVSVFYNPEHTFMRIGNQYWGTSVGDSGAGGLGPHPTPSAAYLSQYNVGHVSGLGGKVAVALGIPLTGGGSFPGMNLSPSGTTATIESGTTNSGKPGFSSKPIRLTQAQKARRTFRRLKQAGIGVGGAKPAEEVPSETLKSLESRYGVKTG